MKLPEFLAWATAQDYLHIMHYTDGNLSAYVQSENPAETQQFFRGIFAHRIFDDYIKLSSMRYYFTIRCEV